MTLTSRRARDVASTDAVETSLAAASRPVVDAERPEMTEAASGFDPALPPVPFAVVRRLRREALLIMAGDRATTVYVIQRGLVRSFVLSDGGRQTTTAVLGPGQIVGLAALLGLSTYHASVQAITPAVVWVIPADRLNEQLRHDPTLLLGVAQALIRRLTFAEGLVKDVALRPVPERIAHVMGLLDPCLGGEPPRLTREMVAALVSARRETVSRAMAPHCEAAG